MKAFLEEKRLRDDPAQRAEVDAMVKSAADVRALHAQNASDGQVDRARASERDQRRAEERQQQQAEYQRRKVWVEQHCERRRVDVTTQDDRLVRDTDGVVRPDTVTQAVGYFRCPKDAPAEMQAFARDPRPPT